MKIVKLALISFVFFFLLITGISLFIPSQVRISRALQINAPKDSVMGQIANPVNWKNWYPGADSLQLLRVAGEPMGIVSPQDPLKGLIITQRNDTAVIAENTGKGAREGSTGWNILPGENAGSVAVQWYMDFKLQWYPWEKFASLMFDKQYGPLMEQGLKKLQDHFTTK